MADPIAGIPQIHGPQRISPGGRPGGRGDKSFADALDHDSHEETAENPDQREELRESTLGPLPRGLKRRRPGGRRDDQDQRHIDVLA